MQIQTSITSFVNIGCQLDFALKENYNTSTCESKSSHNCKNIKSKFKIYIRCVLCSQTFLIFYRFIIYHRKYFVAFFYQLYQAVFDLYWFENQGSGNLQKMKVKNIASMYIHCSLSLFPYHCVLYMLCFMMSIFHSLVGLGDMTICIVGREKRSRIDTFFHHLYDYSNKLAGATCFWQLHLHDIEYQRTNMEERIPCNKPCTVNLVNKSYDEKCTSTAFFT